MAGLPKIVLARLKAKADGTGASRASALPLRFPGAEHPDANLLAAFAEKSLTEKERVEVLDHLNGCADCRTVAAFVLPEDLAVVAPARMAARRPWYSWHVVRWVSIAAAAMVVATVVALRPALWNRHAQVAQVTAPPPAPTANVVANPPPAPAPPAQPQSVRATGKAKVEAEAGGVAGWKAMAKKAPQPGKEMALNQPAAQELAKRQDAMMAEVRPPAAMRSAPAPEMRVEREEPKPASAATAAPAPPPAALSPPVGTRQDTSQANAQSRVGLELARPSAGAVAREDSSAAPSPAIPAAKGGAPTAVPMTAHAAIGSMRAMGKAVEIVPVPRIPLWRVSADGQVQRSTDGGKSYETIHIAGGAKFEAIASLRNHVWAGGTGGTLFHSTDGGATWVQVAVPFEAGTVTETIVGIQLLGPQRVTVTTSSGARWASVDNGRHWQKQS